ncbi:Uncharacterized protein FKW44_013520, partial [Caligus rogercresseyi]
CCIIRQISPPLCPEIVMKDPFTDPHQKWFRYRLATYSLFMSKSHVDPKKRGCHWCGEVEEASFHFFYHCLKVVPVIKAMGDIMLEELG